MHHNIFLGVFIILLSLCALSYYIFIVYRAHKRLTNLKAILILNETSRGKYGEKDNTQ